MNRLRVAACLLFCVAATLTAQEPPIIVSPEIRPDRSVVLRVWAPKAAEVLVTGDWLGTNPPASLSKDTQGVWTVTVGPLPAGIYGYAFLVDGTRTTDPACRCTFAWGGGRASSSGFTIRGDKPTVWENQNRPPGTLHYERFYSNVQQRMRRFVVYTPPRYDPSNSRRYPVMVLLPGTPGDETDWTSGGGFVELLFDNLIAEGRMEPMIVVMHASDVDTRAEQRRGDDNLRQFERILAEELVPAVKQRYRVVGSPDSWAIVGLSLGGEFGMFAGLNHPELFRTIGSISGSLVPSSFERRFGPALARPETAKNYRLLWIGSGTEDTFFNGAKLFTERLQSARIAHTFRQYPGGHVMPVFRQQLEELLPQIFRR
jgi:enterochelin esterase-like enzyme